MTVALSEARITSAIAESLPPSPGAVIAVDDDLLGEAILAAAGARGLRPARPDELADIVVVTRTSDPDSLGRALRRCRDRGTVIYVGDDRIERLDLYPDVHSRGLRLTFCSTEA